MANNLLNLSNNKLSRINGEINNMSLLELKNSLNNFQLNDNGNIEILKKRLKEHYKKSQYKSKSYSALEQKMPRYLVVIDFEATCDENNDNYDHEIIEFPSILIDTQSKTIIDEFHSYVRPILNPHLTTFCTKLTGITQEIVNNSATFTDVFTQWQEWLLQKGLSYSNRFAIVTDGPWDLERFLWLQCCKSKIEMPKYCQRWINIRKLYAGTYKCQRTNIAGMLDAFSMQFEGTQHCGLDDSRNIARILLVMLQDGIIPQINEYLHARHKHLLDGIISASKPTDISSANNEATIQGQYDDVNDVDDDEMADSSIGKDTEFWDEENDISDLMLYASLQKS